MAGATRAAAVVLALLAAVLTLALLLRTTRGASGVVDAAGASSSGGVAKGGDEGRQPASPDGRTRTLESWAVNYRALTPPARPPYANLRGKRFVLTAPLWMAVLKRATEDDRIEADPVDANGVALPNDGVYAPLPTLIGRWQLSSLIERLGARTAVEVGVRTGDFSREIMLRWPSMERLYLVDEWRHLDNYREQLNEVDAEKEKMFQGVQQRYADKGSKVQFIRKEPTEAAKHIPDDSIDFIYFDYRHDYCSMWSYLVAFWPKMRRGGIVAGHDYLDADSPLLQETHQDWSVCPNGDVNRGAVKGAVDDFVRAMGGSAGRLRVTDDAWTTFYFRRIL